MDDARELQCTSANQERERLSNNEVLIGRRPTPKATFDLAFRKKKDSLCENVEQNARRHKIVRNAPMRLERDVDIFGFG